MSSAGAAPRAALPVPNARAEASRKNGAKSRGPKTLEGKARSAQNALKHGMRAQRYVVLPEENAAEFAGLEAAMVAELAPVGALQTVLARRVAVAAWRLARADHIEVELFAERRFGNGGLGLAVIRDGNGTRSFETLLRYRGAAMAEFWRALRTLKALQAEQAAALEMSAGGHAAAERTAPTPPARIPPRPNRGQSASRRNPNEPRPQAEPDEPERAAVRRLAYLPGEPGAAGRTLHEPAVSWLPKEPAPASLSDAERTRTPPDRKGNGAARHFGLPGAERTRRGRRDESQRAVTRPSGARLDASSRSRRPRTTRCSRSRA
jgi:hypothetical protein